MGKQSQSVGPFWLRWAGKDYDWDYDPYVHPESGKREQLEDLRRLALKCLNALSTVG